MTISKLLFKCHNFFQNKLVIIIIITIVFSIRLIGQNIKYKSDFYFSSSFQIQDRRLFDFARKNSVLNKEKDPLDYQFNVFINRTSYDSSKFYFSYGLGYSLKLSKFSRPFDHSFFTGVSTEELRYIQTYYSHQLLINGNLCIELSRKYNKSFSIIFPFDSRFTIIRTIAGTTGKWKESKWGFDFDNIELCAGVKYEVKKIALFASGRIISFQRKDPVIFYDILFKENDPRFLRNKIEINNFIKMNVGLSFLF